MKKYELSISENYVSSWGVVEAVRELFQNALDQEVEFSENKMFYKFQGTQLLIGNKHSELKIESLLLGETTKREDFRTIGKFGEGYKLALLVLTRLGKAVTIYNYCAREVWKAKLIASPKYNGAKILTVEVYGNYFWQKVPDNNLTYQIDGLTGDECEAIVVSNLHLQGCMPANVLHAHYGRILLDPAYRGKIYINGLYVSTENDIRYGYDIKPEYLQLDRDRSTVSGYDLKWRTTAMWRENPGELFLTLVRENAADIEYLKYCGSNSESKYTETADAAYHTFKKEFGEKAYPISTQAEHSAIVRKLGGYEKVRPIVVNENQLALFKTAPAFVAEENALPPETEAAKLTPVELLHGFYVSVENKLEGADLMNLYQIVLRSYSWREAQ